MRSDCHRARVSGYRRYTQESLGRDPDQQRKERCFRLIMSDLGDSLPYRECARAAASWVMTAQFFTISPTARPFSKSAPVGQD